MNKKRKEKSRRLLVTLKPDVEKVLNDFSDMSGVSQSKYINILIRSQMPVMELMISAKEALELGDEKKVEEIIFQAFNLGLGEEVMSMMPADFDMTHVKKITDGWMERAS